MSYEKNPYKQSFTESELSNNITDNDQEKDAVKANERKSVT